MKNEHFFEKRCKWDLEAIAKTGSCAGLSEYIFELIIYTKENANLFLNASA